MPSSLASGAQAATPGYHCKPFTQLGAARLDRQGCIHTARGILKGVRAPYLVHVTFSRHTSSRHPGPLTLPQPRCRCLCSCKLQRETERRAARSARSELESSSSASLSSSVPSQLPPSRGHLNRLPEHEAGDCFFYSSYMYASKNAMSCAAASVAVLLVHVSAGAAMPSLAAHSWRTVLTDMLLSCGHSGKC